MLRFTRLHAFVLLIKSYFFVVVFFFDRAKLALYKHFADLRCKVERRNKSCDNARSRSLVLAGAVSSRSCPLIIY